MRATVVVFALGGVLAAGETEARQRFQEELGKVYNYLPADVGQSVRDKKVAEMVGFWKFVATDLDTYLPLLREALRDKSQNRYFCFDGSALLFKQSKAKEDLELVVTALRRSRIEDVGTKGYFYFVHTICGEAVDAFPVVAKMLEHPSFRVVVRKHAMQLDQTDAVLFCLLRQDESLWVPVLAKRLQTEKDGTARHTIAFCLALAIDGKADAALRKLGQAIQGDTKTKMLIQTLLSAPSKDQLPERKPTSTRAEVDTFLASCEAKGRVPDDSERLMRDALYLVVKKDERRIRAARRKAAARVSDEARSEIQYLTGLLRCAVTSRH